MTIDPILARDFDPLQDHFIAQSSRPGELRKLNLRVLSPYHRALLVIDGTVTKFIEAYQMEPVDVHLQSQTDLVLKEDHVWLDVCKNTSVVEREVILQGRHSEAIYVYAISYVILERLPSRIRESLATSGEGLGRILLNNQLESYREILWCGMEHLPTPPSQLANLGVNDFISRSYRIITDTKPIMVINEKFPINLDQLPAHH